MHKIMPSETDFLADLTRTIIQFYICCGITEQLFTEQ